MSDVLLLLLVLTIPFIRTPLRFTSPFGYIAGFVGFMFVCKYFYNQWVGIDFLEGVDPTELATHLRPLAAYLAIGFTLSMPFCGSRSAKEVAAAAETDGTGFELTTFALTLITILPVFLVALGLAIGVNPLNNPLAFRQFLQGQGMFYLLSIYIFLLGALSIYVPVRIIRERRIPPKLVMIAYLVSAMFAIISGFASMIVSMVTTPLFFWSVCYRKRIEVLLVLLLPVVVAFTLLYSAYRDINLSGGGISVSDAVDIVTSNPEAIGKALNRFDYLENYAKADRYLSTRDPDWGASMLGFFIQPIPRVIWPGKPENFSTSLTRELLPQNLAIGVTANFNSLNEFVGAFGSAGIAIGGVVLAIILSVTYCIFDAAAGRPYLATYFCNVIFKFVAVGFFAGFINDLALPLFLLDNIFFQLFVRRTRPVVHSSEHLVKSEASN